MQNYEWTTDLAYAVGLITTDGSLSKDGRHIDFTSKDLEQIQNLKKILNVSSKVGLKRVGKTNKETYYRLQIGDIRLYYFLVSIGLHPNKSKTLKEIIVPDKYFIDFLRGFFDGDGFSYSYWDKRWKSSFELYVGFVSASKTILEWIRLKVTELYGLKGALKQDKEYFFQLKYAKRESLQLLKKIYYADKIICLDRKKCKIQTALDIISKHAGMAKLVYALP